MTTSSDSSVPVATPKAERICRTCLGAGKVRQEMDDSVDFRWRWSLRCLDCGKESPDAWRADPHYGGCTVCHDLLDLDANGEPVAHFHGGTGVPSESEAEYAEAAHIPTLYRECRITNHEPRNNSNRAAVWEWCKSWPPADPLLVLTGNRGTGKTHLAVGAVMEVRRRNGIRGRFWPFADLLARYRDTFEADRATESAAAIDAEMRRTPLLVLDDLGANKSSEWADEAMFRLVDERYRERKPTIITTNLSIKQLPERVMSRLASGHVINFTGKDRRMQ